jgi:hypothetical protein
MMETKANKILVKEQIKNAFEFLQRLYYESSYLIKEIEGQLGESEHRFQILKPSGYSITSRSSNGLEANFVYSWMLRKFSVAFVEEEVAERTKGQNFTEINDQLKVLYFKFKLDEKNLDQPKLYFGVLYDVEKYKDWVKKFEHLMGALEYVDYKLFSKFPNIDYQDGTFKVKGKFKMVNLLDINSSQDLNEKVIEPAIKIYEQIKPI